MQHAKRIHQGTHLKAWIGGAVAALALLPMPVKAALSQATITEKVNVVTVRDSAASSPKPAREGAQVAGDNIVRTGAKSRAALEFEDQSLARLGANTVFSFNSDARKVEFHQGSALFSKPKNGERLNIQTAAVTAAITGSTAFISVLEPKGESAGGGEGGDCPQETVLFGMLEGKTSGQAKWCNPKTGREESIKFKIGAGEMLVREPGKRPVVVQFDLPRFLRTSPLVNDFSDPLPNQRHIDRALAHYQRMESRGFVEPTNVLVANSDAGLAYGFQQSGPPTQDSGIQQLAFLEQTRNAPTNLPIASDSVQVASLSTQLPGPGGFEPVGGSADIRGQIVWTTAADLDLHLILPDMQEVFFGNKVVHFNNNTATATLDADNLGSTVNVAPDKRVENIIITGTPAPGDYTFFIRNFNSSEPTTGTLTVSGDGGATTQTLQSTINDGQNSPSLVISVP